MSSRLDFRVRIWETIKTAGLLFGGTLVAIGGIAARHDTPPSVLGILGVGLIILGAILAQWTCVNVRREQRLQLNDEFALYQIEELLDLHRRIPEDMQWIHREIPENMRWLYKKSPEDRPKYEYMFARKHLWPPPNQSSRSALLRTRDWLSNNYPKTLKWFDWVLDHRPLTERWRPDRKTDAVEDYVNELLQDFRLPQNSSYPSKGCYRWMGRRLCCRGSSARKQTQFFPTDCMVLRGAYDSSCTV